MGAISNLYACSKRGLWAALFMFAVWVPVAASAQDDVEALRADAAWMFDLIENQYAYSDRFDGRNPARGARGVDVDAINSRADLLQFGECALNALRDHHAIMGVSGSSSPGVVPSYSDLWIDVEQGRYVIGEVRAGSPAQRAGVRPGWALVSVGGRPIDASVDQLCGGPFESADDRAFAARVLSVGPRDQSRRLGFETENGEIVTMELASLYAENRPWPGPITAETLEDGLLLLTVHNSLGENGFRDAVDAVMAEQDPTGVIIDLRDTASGGNTLNARALLGRFVDAQTPYQRHSIPAIERQTGITRQWVEEVGPLEPNLSDVPVVVLVGRWTGSMGEGTAIGFQAAAGASIVGAPMAGLLGAIIDTPMPNTGWIVKLPSEALFHVDGTPREAVIPDVLVDDVEVRPEEGVDRGLEAALGEIRRLMSER